MQADDIKQLVQVRLKDAQALYDVARFDGSVYLCGYALELGLKARICRNLQWDKYPPTAGRDYASFKTHNLAVLLNLTGLESHITRLGSSYCADWSIVASWNPESRYNPMGNITEPKAQNMLDSTKIILEQVL